MTHETPKNNSAKPMSTTKQQPAGATRSNSLRRASAKDDAAFSALGIKRAGEINGKPRFLVHSKQVLNLKSHFGEKRLCDGATFTIGHACVFSCQFCYVEAILSKNVRINRILKTMRLKFDQIVVDIADPGAAARKQLLSRGNPKFSDPRDNRVIYASPLVDVAGTMQHVTMTVEICLAILELTHWQIRLLSKSSLLEQVARRIPNQYKDRLIFGFSTGTLDDGLASSFERGTALVSKRLQALHRLQDDGYRTFGMVCPSLPQLDYDAFAEQASRAIRSERCEHVWGEVFNVRGDSLGATRAALLQGGYSQQAAMLAQVSFDRIAREDNARQTFLALARVIPPGKLRFMQYVAKDTRSWWKAQEPNGALLLGCHANEPTDIPQPATSHDASHGNASMLPQLH